MTAAARKLAYARAREQIYSLAVHDVRRMCEKMAPDDLLISHIFRRLAKAVAEAYEIDLDELSEHD